jgi:hypothetical protein
MNARQSGVDATVAKIVAYLKDDPGAAGEVVRNELDLEKKRWSAAVAKALEAKTVRKEGEKRSTRYWAA